MNLNQIRREKAFVNKNYYRQKYQIRCLKGKKIELQNIEDLRIVMLIIDYLQ